MMNIQSLLLLHIAGAVLWVGGMFAVVCSRRPVAGELLEPPAARLRLWRGVFRRFFTGSGAPCWWAVASGLLLLGAAGFRAAPPGRAPGWRPAARS